MEEIGEDDRQANAHGAREEDDGEGDQFEMRRCLGVSA